MDNKDRENLICFLAKFQGGGEPSKDIFSRYPTSDLLKSILIPMELLTTEIKLYIESDEDIDEDDTKIDEVVSRIFYEARDQVEKLGDLEWMWNDGCGGGLCRFENSDYYLMAERDIRIFPTYREALEILMENPEWLTASQVKHDQFENILDLLVWYVFGKIIPYLRILFEAYARQKYREINGKEYQEDSK